MKDFKRGCIHGLWKILDLFERRYLKASSFIYIVSLARIIDTCAYIRVRISVCEKDSHFGGAVGNDAICFAVITIDRYDRFEVDRYFYEESANIPSFFGLSSAWLMGRGSLLSVDTVCSFPRVTHGRHKYRSDRITHFGPSRYVRGEAVSANEHSSQYPRTEPNIGN